MKPENIISAAQARLNFCDPKYVALYKEVCNQITDLSRIQTHVKINTDVDATVRNRIVQELIDLGYKVNCWHKEYSVFTLAISW